MLTGLHELRSLTEYWQDTVTRNSVLRKWLTGVQPPL